MLLKDKRGLDRNGWSKFSQNHLGFPRVIVATLYRTPTSSPLMTQRLHTHDSIIKAALGIPFGKPTNEVDRLMSSRLAKPLPTDSELTSIILDAELVAYSEKKQKTDEFCNLARLMRHLGGTDGKPLPYLDEAEDEDFSQASTASNRVYKNYICHLSVVFFDLMSLNGETWMYRSHTSRRQQLEKLIRPIHGFVSASAPST